MSEGGETLKGKRILIVDDEPDILGSLEDILDDCVLDRAESYEGAASLLEKQVYDVAILDIMGVRGYDLLALANQRGVPVLMLTAHALSPDNLIKSVKEGARAYVPKDKISEIRTYLSDVLEEAPRCGRLGRWFARLEPFFEETFGEYWKEKSDPEFWRRYY
jgi:DNA-binding NtrC family response regulator